MKIAFFPQTIAALVAAFVLSLSSVQAAPLLAEGIAPLDGGTAAARELAIRDALRQAAVSSGGEIQSEQLMDSGNVSEVSVLSAPSLQGRVKVLDEFSRNGLYHVTLQIEPTAGAATSKSAAVAQGRQDKSVSCGMPAGRSLKRKLLTTYFLVVNPAEANDLQDLATNVPAELARRLGNLGNFDVHQANRLSVLPDPRMPDPASAWDAVRELGRREDVQFVVAGRILSTGAVDKSLHATLYDSNNTSEQGTYYNGPLAGLFGGALKYQATARQFDMEVWVYDALTGALLANQRIDDVARGKIVEQVPSPFGSAGFWHGDYGRMVDKLLDGASQKVVDLVSCIPLTAKVLRVDEGRRVYVSAGGLDGLAVGDQMMLYKPRSAEMLRANGTSRDLGMPEDLSGSISIIQVQPNFSIGVVQSAQLKVEEGDFLRFMVKH